MTTSKLMQHALDSQVLLPRRRLIDLMRKGLAGRATLLVAPAGYGKTCVVSEFAGSVAVPMIWCVFKPEDVGPGPFVRKILQAIEKELSGPNGATFGPAFTNVEPRRQLRAGLAELANASSSTYCTLVLEDYHYPAISDEVNELTGQLLEELPNEIHLIITSRVWPDIGQIPKMVAQRQVSVLESHDLAFTYDEVAAFLRLATGSSPRDDEIRQLLKATRGWPACVVLLGAQGIPHRAVTQKSPGLYAYFAAEILRGLPLPMARFMLDTSVLPVVAAGLCDELLNRRDAAVLLEQLRAKRLLQPSPSHRDAYEYHPLMREFLLSRLRAGSPRRYAKLHSQAAALFRRDRHWQESVDLLTSVGAWPQLADVLEEITPGILRQGMWGVLSEWIDRLPEDLLLTRDELVLVRSRLAYLQRDPPTALRLLDSARHLLASPEGLVSKAAALSLQGRNAEAITLAKRGLDLATRAGNVDVACDAQLWLGVARSVKGSYASAEKSLRTALRHFIAVGNLYSQAVCYIHLAGICHFEGKVDEETVFLENAERLWRKLGNREQLARTLNNLGVSYHQRGSYEEALSAFTQCSELAQRLGLGMEEAYCLTGMADLFRDQSMLNRAGILYAHAVELAKELGEGLLYVCVLAGQAELKRLEHELDGAEAIVKRALVEAVEHRNPQEEGICLTVLGAVYRDQGKLADGIGVLERACRLLEEAGSRIEAAKANFLLASTLFRARQRSRALNRLEKVADIGRTIGHDQFVSPLLRRDRSLIQYAAAKCYGRNPFPQWLARVTGPVHRGSTGTEPSVGMPTVELRALGDFAVLINDLPVSDLAWQTTKAKEMFLYLVVNRRPVLKEETVELLWPDLPSTKCNSYFHSNLYRLRQVVHRDCVIREGPRYSLNPEGVFRSDVTDFLDSVGLCRKDETSIDGLRRAVSLYAGPFAPEVFSDWAGAIRSQLEHQYLWVLDKLLERVLCSGNGAELATLCEKMLDVDPFHEVAWKELIQYHRDRGLLGLTMRLYRQCTDVFASQLGTEVPPAVASLVRSA